MKHLLDSAAPILALTCGDVEGIGPEIVIKSLAVARVREWCRPVVFGPPAMLERITDSLHLGMRLRPVSSLSEAEFEPDLVDVWIPDSNSQQLSSLDYLTAAIEMARAGQVNGIASAATTISSASNDGARIGLAHASARLCGVRDWATMLSSGALRVSFVSTYLPLRQAISSLSRQRVLETLQLTSNACSLLGLSARPIAAAGLNPVSENYEDPDSEEASIIRPAIEDAVAAGFAVVGPLAPESVFLRAVRGEFSAVVAMHHGQGYVPIRVLGTRSIVELTLGLPFPHTGVDNGADSEPTAEGMANPGEMVEAIRLAARLAV